VSKEHGTASNAAGQQMQTKYLGPSRRRPWQAARTFPREKKKKKRQQQDTFSVSPRFRIKTQSSSIIPVGSRKVITSSREKEKEENIEPGRE
jgi:hypothetical protein